MLGLREAKDIVEGIIPLDGDRKMGSSQLVLLIKALREASAAGYKAGRAAAPTHAELEDAFDKGMRAGEAAAFRKAEEEFQQRAVEYVAGCLSTAEQLAKLSKRVA